MLFVGWRLRLRLGARRRGRSFSTGETPIDMTVADLSTFGEARALLRTMRAPPGTWTNTAQSLPTTPRDFAPPTVSSAVFAGHAADMQDADHMPPVNAAKPRARAQSASVAMLRRRLQVYAPRVLRPGDLGDDDNDGADYGADYGGGDGDGGYFSFVNGVNGLIKLVRGKMSERDARLVVQAIRKAKPRKKACEYCMAFRVGGGYLTRGYGKRCQCCGNHIDINLGELGHTFEKEVFQELVEEEKVREKSTGRVKVAIANVAPPVRPKAEVHVFEKAKDKKKKKPKEEEYEAYVPPPREEVRVVEEAKQQTKKDEVYAATYTRAPKKDRLWDPMQMADELHNQLLTEVVDEMVREIAEGTPYIPPPGCKVAPAPASVVETVAKQFEFDYDAYAATLGNTLLKEVVDEMAREIAAACLVKEPDVEECTYAAVAAAKKAKRLKKRAKKEKAPKAAEAAEPEPEPAERGVILSGWAFFLISSGSPHVRCTPMGHTCGEPNEIELTAAYGLCYRPFFQA